MGRFYVLEWMLAELRGETSPFELRPRDRAILDAESDVRAGDLAWAKRSAGGRQRGAEICARHLRQDVFLPFQFFKI